MFAAIVWTLFITCMLYFMSLLTAKGSIDPNVPRSHKAAVLFINVAAVALACYLFAMSINLTVFIIVGVLSVIGFITGFRIDFDEVSAKSQKFKLHYKEQLNPMSQPSNSTFALSFTKTLPEMISKDQLAFRMLRFAKEEYNVDKLEQTVDSYRLHLKNGTSESFSRKEVIRELFMHYKGRASYDDVTYAVDAFIDLV